MIFTDHINRRLYVTQNEGESFTGKTILDSPDLLVFHPTKEKWVLRYSDQSNTVKIYYRYNNLYLFFDIHVYAKTENVIYLDLIMIKLLKRADLRAADL